jgi:hypothetical protein
MDSRKTPVRVQSGGTKISRRTVARGAAWAAPIAAVATAAPAFAASCVPQVSFDPSRSCKCPGQSSTGEEYVYYLAFCVNNACTTGTGSGGTFVVTNAVKDNGGAFPQVPNQCFTASLNTFPPTNVGSCTTDVYRFESDNSGNFVLVTFSVTVNGVTTQYTQKVPSPPFCDCKNGGCTDGRCGEKNAQNVICNP